MSNDNEMSASPEFTEDIRNLVAELRNNTKSNEQLIALVDRDLKRRRWIDRAVIVLLAGIAILAVLVGFLQWTGRTRGLEIQTLTRTINECITPHHPCSDAAAAQRIASQRRDVTLAVVSAWCARDATTIAALNTCVAIGLEPAGGATTPGVKP